MPGLLPAGREKGRRTPGLDIQATEDGGCFDNGREGRAYFAQLDDFIHQLLIPGGFRPVPRLQGPSLGGALGGDDIGHAPHAAVPAG